MQPPAAPSTGRRLLAVLQLLLRFGKAMVASGVQTLRIIVLHGLRLRPLPPSGLRSVTFAPMQPRGVALLAAMVSLTPGTTVIEIDMERHEMLIHMLDTREAEVAAADIRATFETPLLVLFGGYA